MLSRKIQAVLIDIAGVLYVGERPTRDAQQAIQRLAEAGLPYRFLTNTTRSTAAALVAKLAKMDFEVSPDCLFTAPLATLRFIVHHGLRPYLLIHPALSAEFSAVNCEAPNCVVVGDAGEAFNYQTLNTAFRVLMEGGTLIGMGQNRYFREPDGLSLDMGPFVEALRFGAGADPIIMGKPSAAFFQQALDDLGVQAGHTVMIGDDLEADVLGAQRQGIQGVLVRTGKFRSSDEASKEIVPDFIADDFALAVDKVLERLS